MIFLHVALFRTLYSLILSENYRTTNLLYQGITALYPRQVVLPPFLYGLASLVLWVLLLRFIVPFLLGIVSIIFNKAGMMTTTTPKEMPSTQVMTQFSDVFGVDEAKSELETIVSYLKHPEAFRRIGSRLPRGVLLYGLPGTGKTLLARAVAGEACVPFFYASASEFDQMFVGVGADRVRQLYAAARQKAPCVVFIDEIDAVGSSRTLSSPGDSNATWTANRQTLNQLLTELDGFAGSEGVITIAATNVPEALDPALTRSGRFDKRVAVPLPDMEGRRQILSHYLSQVRCRVLPCSTLTPAEHPEECAEHFPDALPPHSPVGTPDVRAPGQYVPSFAAAVQGNARTTLDLNGYSGSRDFPNDEVQCRGEDSPGAVADPTISQEFENTAAGSVSVRDQPIVMCAEERMGGFGSERVGTATSGAAGEARRSSAVHGPGGKVGSSASAFPSDGGVSGEVQSLRGVTGMSGPRQNLDMSEKASVQREMRVPQRINNGRESAQRYDTVEGKEGLEISSSQGRCPHTLPNMGEGVGVCSQEGDGGGLKNSVEKVQRGALSEPKEAELNTPPVGARASGSVRGSVSGRVEIEDSICASVSGHKRDEDRASVSGRLEEVTSCASVSGHKRDEDRVGANGRIEDEDCANVSECHKRDEDRVGVNGSREDKDQHDTICGSMSGHKRDEDRASVSGRVEDVDISRGVCALQLARGTFGLSGADLEAIVNEAAILAAAMGDTAVDSRHVRMAKDKLMLGSERKSLQLSARDRVHTAVHEAGHCLVAWCLRDAMPVREVTIVPRATALGLVAQSPLEDMFCVRRSELTARLCVALAGRAAETLEFGEDSVSTGGANDFEVATKLARDMAATYGMGPTHTNRSPPVSLLWDSGAKLRDHVDDQVHVLLSEAWEKATHVLSESQDKLRILRDALLDKETLQPADLTSLLGPPAYAQNPVWQ
eukprot:Rmarinus@m.23689